MSEEQTVTIVVLDPVGPVLPTYRVFATTQCVRCAGEVWLGSKSWLAVALGTMAPLCMPCAEYATRLGLMTDETRCGEVGDT